MEKSVSGCARFGGGKNGFESLTSTESSSSENYSSSSGAGSSFAEGREAVSSPPLLGWPLRKAAPFGSSGGSKNGDKKKVTHLDDSVFKRLSSEISDIDLMKQRIAKLLLGEDMSGSGKGVCPALAISNAITNLSGAILGQLWRLEPLPVEKKSMWRREMECLLCVSDHIVELVPSSQTFPDGSKLEVMTCRPRSDLLIGLPALRKLDNMLLEILDSFGETEFWYVDQGILTPEPDGSASFRKRVQQQEEKWWLPLPRVPPGGLGENSRKRLNHTRECASQILKAALAINSIALAEIEVPEAYLEALPKNARSCLGDVLYRHVTSDQFSTEQLLDCLDLSSEQLALDFANCVEASIYVWRRRAHSRPLTNDSRSTAKSSWEMVKDIMVDGDKRELLAERVESLLICLKQRFPGLRQTALDTSKIQYNKDVGKSILESYSRVLESLAHNIVVRIDELLYIDDLTKHSGKLPSAPFSVSLSGTPYKTTFSTPSFSPLPLISPARGERTPFLSCRNIKERRGLGVRRALSSYLGVDSKAKLCSKGCSRH